LAQKYNQITDNDDGGRLAQPGNMQNKTSSPRLVSLDAFRGLTIIGMLLVNNTMLGALTPVQLMHARWNDGLTFADMVFPWFLLIVGVAIPYSVSSFKKKNLPAWSYYLKAMTRAFWLVTLGCFLDSSVAKRPMIGLGVLQLIGLAYLCGASLYSARPYIRASMAALLLIGYWAAIRFIPVPGLGSGHFSESGNLILHLNNTYLSSYHLNGILSVIPTTALVLIGTLVGDILRAKVARDYVKPIHIGCLGIALMVAGYLWNLDIPFNKPVWTPSYILFSAGIGSLVLSIFYVVADVYGKRWWTYPLTVTGVNAIVAYTAPILVKVYILQGWWYNYHNVSIQQALVDAAKRLAGPVGGGWLYTAGYIVVWWCVLLYLHRRGLYLKL